MEVFNVWCKVINGFDAHKVIENSLDLRIWKKCNKRKETNMILFLLLDLQTKFLKSDNSLLDHHLCQSKTHGN